MDVIGSGEIRRRQSRASNLVNKLPLGSAIAGKAPAFLVLGATVEVGDSHATLPRMNAVALIWLP